MRKVIAETCIAISCMALPCAQAQASGIIDFGNSMTLSASQLAGIHKLGVISTFPDTLSIENVGTTAFENEKATADISAWQINSLVVGDVAADLNGRIEVKPVNSKIEAFRSADSHLFHSIDSQFRDLVMSLPDEGVDAYLIIQAQQPRDPIGGTNQYVDGLGIYHRNFLGMKFSAEHAYFYMWLLDAKTGELIARAPGCPNDSSACIDGVSRNVPDFEGPSSPTQLSALHDDFTLMLSQGVSGGLADMGLATPAK